MATAPHGLDRAGGAGGRGGGLRVLVVTNLYPPHHFGGYELACADTVAGFRARGHDVTVLTTEFVRAGAPMGSDDGVLRELKWYWDDHHLLDPSVGQRLRIERHNHRVFASALGRARPDVVSFWNMGAMSLGLVTAAADRRLPVVYVVFGDWAVHGLAMDPWARLFAGRPRMARAVRALTGVPTSTEGLGSWGRACFISEAVRGDARQRSPWRFTDAVVTHAGIDLASFTRGAPNGRPWTWRLLYAGRLDPRKGIESAVRALERLPDATLELNGRGDGEEEARLAALASALGVGARIERRDDARSALPDRYRGADVVVFPPTWAEPFGLVPLEAMACGTPVIATGTGGSAEYLRDGENCLLFVPGDPASLAAAVGRLARDERLRASLVEGGLATASRFGVDGMVASLEAHHLAVTRCGA
jgi:glycosyltransferase involved in cell wall biosynthesis